MQPSPAELRSPALNPGDEPIPGFRLVRRRGRGGFGEVWEAEAPGGFLVALKFVRLSSRARAAELRALEFVRGIHHPNLLANFGSWQVDDNLIIGMELADRSLWDRYVEAADQGLRGIPRAELLGYLAEVAAGIVHLNQYRHSFDGRTGIGVQHRDLKPSNILLFGGGAKVADLGMARAMEGEVAGHTGIWTFAYAAPEFFRGETNRQSDQYGLAATYCQLRGGRLPFEGTAASVTAGHLFGKPDLDALPEPERPIVERALAKVPGDRWPDCRAFVDALRAIPPGEVPDVLVEPTDPVDIPRELRSSTGAISALATGFDPHSGPGSGIGRRGFDSTDDLDTGAPPPARLPGHPTAPASSDQVPTRILPSTATGATPEPPPAIEEAAEARPLAARPAPSRRPSRVGRRAAAVTATAIALAAVGIHVPGGHDHAPVLADRRPDDPAPADPGPRPPDPASIVAAGIGSAAGPDGLDPPAPTPPDDPPAPTPLPAAPIAARVSLKPVEPEPAPATAAEEIRPPSIATPEPEIPPVAAPTRPGPVPDPGALPDLALEGPIGPEAAAPGGLAPLPEKPPVPADAPPRPADSPAPIVRLTPSRDAPPAVPDPAARVVAFNEPPTTLSPFRAVAPSPAEAAFARGRDLLLRQSFAPAVAAFDEAIRLDPGLVASYLPRAVARHRSGHPEGALADYDEAIRRRPADPLAYIARGQAQHDLGAYHRAIADFDRAIQLNPGDADARLRRGLARYRSGDFAGSIVDLDEAIRLDPKNDRAIEFRADARARVEAEARRTPAHPDPQPAPQPARINPPAAGPPATNPAPPPARRRQPLRQLLPPLPFLRRR